MASPFGPPRVLDARSFAFDVAFLDARRVACALLEGGAHRLVVFSVESGARLQEFSVAAESDWVHAVALSPDGQRAAVALRRVRARGEALVASGLVRVLDLKAGRIERTFAMATPVRAVTFVDRDHLLFATEASRARSRPDAPAVGRVCAAALEGGAPTCRPAHADDVTALTLVPSGFASGSADGTIQFWSRELVPRALVRAGGAVNALAVRPAQRGDARAEQLLVATSHAPARRTPALVALERRGGHRAGPAPGDAVEVWDLGRLRRVSVATPHRFYVTELAASRDGSALASGGWDFAVALFRGGGWHRLDAFSQIVTGLAFSPSGATLAVSAWTEARSGSPSCLLLPLSR